MDVDNSAIPASLLRVLFQHSDFGSCLGGACSPVLTGLIVDRTGSFVVALAVGGIVMAVGAAIYYFMVGSVIIDADLVVEI